MTAKGVSSTKVTLLQPTPITLSDWRGLYSRGTEDSVPLGYFSDCLNVNYKQKEVSTRMGTDLIFTKSNIIRHAVYHRINEASRFMVLDSSGNFYDSLYPNNPLITNVALLDFSMVVLFNRAYITFHNRITGISGINLYVYQGAGPGTLRPAAGTAPSAFTLGVATSASSGNVEVGTHLFAVAFESDSGFISAPGPAAFTEYEAPGGFAVDISSIPIGPSGTAARWILATQTQVLYDGNQDGAELFFAVRIGNNSATTYSALSFFDSDLLDSADYLLDVRSTIPAGVFISSYGNRLILGGFNGNERSLYISKDSEPESFDATNGIITVSPDNLLTGLLNGVEFRGTFYFGSSSKFFSTLDNLNDPNTWTVSDVDIAVGTQPFGISKVLDAKSNTTSRFFMAAPSGLLVFEAGIFQRPEVSWNIEDVWKRINKTKFDLVQVVHDTENSYVYIAVPLDSATAISHILVGWYGNALIPPGFIVPSEMRWSIWSFPSAPKSITMGLNTSTKPVLRMTGTLGIYEISDTTRNDAGTTIDSYVKLAFLNQVPGWYHQFTEVQYRVIGVGSLNTILTGEDGINSTTLAITTLSTTAGKEPYRLANFKNEKCAVKFSLVSTINSWFTVSQIIVMAKPLWENRPLA